MGGGLGDGMMEGVWLPQARYRGYSPLRETPREYFEYVPQGPLGSGVTLNAFLLPLERYRFEIITKFDIDLINIYQFEP